MGYRVILDACVLYSATARDILLELAMPKYSIFQAKWTDEITDEWLRNLKSNRPDLPVEKLDKLSVTMREVVPDCIVSGYEDLIVGLRLPDAGDCHVLAAAIRCGANAIVTFNLKDFPDEFVGKYDIEVMHPDEFLVKQADLSLPIIVNAFKACHARCQRPSFTVDEYLDVLVANKLVGFSEKLKENRDLLDG